MLSFLQPLSRSLRRRQAAGLALPPSLPGDLVGALLDRAPELGVAFHGCAARGQRARGRPRGALAPSPFPTRTLVTPSVGPAFASELGRGHRRGTGGRSSGVCRWVLGFPRGPGAGWRRGAGEETVQQHSCGRWALLPTGPAPELLSGMLQRQAEPRSFPHPALFPLTPRRPQVSVEAASSRISPSWKREPEETCPQEYRSSLPSPVPILDWGFRGSQRTG